MEIAIRAIRNGYFPRDFWMKPELNYCFERVVITIFSYFCHCDHIIVLIEYLWHVSNPLVEGEIHTFPKILSDNWFPMEKPFEFLLFFVVVNSYFCYKHSTHSRSCTILYLCVAYITNKTSMYTLWQCQFRLPSISGYEIVSRLLHMEWLLGAEK